MTGKVSTSKMSRSGGKPCSPQAMLWIRRATSTLRSAAWAMPCSSMVMAMTEAPCSSARSTTRSVLARPASRLVELSTHCPGYASRAARITSGSVLSITIGASTDERSRLTTSTIWCASSLRSVSATHTSRRWAPPSTCSRATSRT